MKKLIFGILIGFLLSMGLRTGHSVLCDHYWYRCINENAGHENNYFNPIKCMNEKMGNLNLLSKISGFPMYFFDKWEWYG